MARLRLLFLIALKNIFRNRRRTILTVLILVLGSTGLILVGGFFDSLMSRLRDGYIETVTGHLQISHEGFFREGLKDPLEYMVEDAEEIRESLNNNPKVVSTFVRLTFTGMLSNGEANIPVFALGVEPKRNVMLNEKFFPGGVNPYSGIKEGKPLSEEDPYGIEIGVELKEAMGLKLGDTVDFITSRRQGAIEGAEFHIRGIFQSSLRDVGGKLIQVPITTAQEILGIPNQVQTINVILKDYLSTQTVEKALEKEFKENDLNLEVIPWSQQNVFYEQSRRFLDYIYRTIQIILSVIFFISIANITNMTLFERIREYGTMMAIGNKRATVATLIVMESGIIGFLGASIGLLVAYLVSELISSVGFVIPPPPNVNISIILTILLSPALILSTFFICFLATVLSSLIPAYRASHFRIIEALGYV